MAATTDLDLVMVLFRGAVLIIAALSGAMSIFLGWKLYKDGMLSDVSGEASGLNGLQIKLVSAGPGIFFAAFGMGLLVFLAARQLDMSEAVEPAEPAAAAAVTKSAGAGAPEVCGQEAEPVEFIRLQAKAAPPARCLVRRSRRLFLDGNTLDAARVRRDAETAQRLLLSADRTGLSAVQKRSLDDAAETMRAIREGATDE